MAPPKKRRGFTIEITVILIIIILAVVYDLAGDKILGRKRVLLRTSMGDIVILLDKEMPITAGNFENLTRAGFYNGTTFHRIINGFMIQGGDPTGTGGGGPGYSIKDEFTPHNNNTRGTIAMANRGPDTGGSQFFINLVDNDYLDDRHPVFGKVTAGMNVVDKIAAVQTDVKGKPMEEVRIISAKIL